MSQGGSEILRPRLTQNPNCLGVVVWTWKVPSGSCAYNLVRRWSCCWGGCGNAKRSPVRGSMSLGWPWSFYSLVLFAVLLVPDSCMLMKCDQPASWLPLHLYAPVPTPSLLWRSHPLWNWQSKQTFFSLSFFFFLWQNFCLNNRKVI